jgi:hypothetical protein
MNRLNRSGLADSDALLYVSKPSELGLSPGISNTIENHIAASNTAQHEQRSTHNRHDIIRDARCVLDLTRSFIIETLGVRTTGTSLCFARQQSTLMKYAGYL